MTKVGTFTYFWRETRYLPLVLEQLARVQDRVSSIVYQCDYPLNWPSEPEKSDPFTSEHSSLITITPWIDKHTNDPLATAVLLNACLGALQAHGVEVALWIDSDFLFDLNDFDTLVDSVSSQPPSWWRVEASHYWRSFKTTYATTGFRIAVPTTARWIGRWGFADEPLEMPTIPRGVRCHHPSWALSDDEIVRKVQSWYHAPEFKLMGYPEKWFSGEADREQVNLQPAAGLPIGLFERLTKHGVYL